MTQAPDVRERTQGDKRTDKKDGHDRRPGPKGGKGAQASKKPSSPPPAPDRIGVVKNLVDRVNGVPVYKESKVNFTAAVPVAAIYLVDFPGHESIKFSSLHAAREQAKLGPPEVKQAVSEDAVDVREQEESVENTSDELEVA